MFEGGKARGPNDSSRRGEHQRHQMKSNIVAFAGFDRIFRSKFPRKRYRQTRRKLASTKSQNHVPRFSSLCHSHPASFRELLFREVIFFAQAAVALCFYVQVTENFLLLKVWHPHPGWCFVNLCKEAWGSSADTQKNVRTNTNRNLQDAGAEKNGGFRGDYQGESPVLRSGQHRWRL